jgi:hypothetical protein
MTFGRAVRRNRAVRLKTTSRAVAISLAMLGPALPIFAQTSPPLSTTPSPSPRATSAAPSDPCGSILSIVTRPTVTTSVCNVRAGHVLIENGYTNTIVTGPGGGTIANYPQSFLRVGLSQHMELAFTPPSYSRSSESGALVTGSTDMNFGAKWELGYTERAVWGANLQVSVPTGSPAFTAGGPQYTANLNWSYTLSSVFGAAGTIGFNGLSGTTTSGQLQRYSAVIPTALLTAALPGASQLFGEYVYFSRAGPGLGGKSLVDFGYQRDLGEHVQLDIEYGFQPTVISGQKQHYFGAGFSFMN